MLVHVNAIKEVKLINLMSEHPDIFTCNDYTGLEFLHQGMESTKLLVVMYLLQLMDSLIRAYLYILINSC